MTDRAQIGPKLWVRVAIAVVAVAVGGLLVAVAEVAVSLYPGGDLLLEILYVAAFLLAGLAIAVVFALAPYSGWDESEDTEGERDGLPAWSELSAADREYITEKVQFDTDTFVTQERVELAYERIRARNDVAELEDTIDD